MQAELHSTIDNLNFVNTTIQKRKMLIKQQARLDDFSIEKTSKKLKTQVVRQLNKIVYSKNSPSQNAVHDLKAQLQLP